MEGKEPEPGQKKIQFISPFRSFCFCRWGQASSSIRPKSESPNDNRRETNFWTFLQKTFGRWDIRSAKTSWRRRTCWTLRLSNFLKLVDFPSCHLTGQFELTNRLRSNCRHIDISTSFRESFGLRGLGRVGDSTGLRKLSEIFGNLFKIAFIPICVRTKQ